MPVWLGFIGLAGLLVAFWIEGIAHMVGVWAISPTYTHGFLILPISCCLVAMGWRRGEGLVPWPIALWGLLAASGLYTVGIKSDIQLIQHTAIVLGIIALALFSLGATAAWRHRFALGFLVFAIPFGEELTPALQELTAQAIMGATTLANLPAIRDGMLIQTDAGNFSVEEACAGLRFLTATVVSAVLMNHLFFTKRRKQVLFLVSALILPLFANSVRAAGTVLVASWTDMKVAAGVDHLLYGWAFFFVILTVLVTGGVVLSDKDAPHRPSPPLVEGESMPILYIVVAALIISLPRVI